MTRHFYIRGATHLSSLFTVSTLFIHKRHEKA